MSRTSSAKKRQQSVSHTDLHTDMIKTETMAERTKRHDDLAAQILLCFFISLFALATYIAMAETNPDSDTLWLIPTGKWIVEHKCVPHTNPFTYTQNLGIIVQQPLCAILNYLYATIRGGISHLWELAMAENVILIAAVTVFLSKRKLYPIRLISTLIFVELFVTSSGYITTRPYQLTMVNLLILITVLENARLKDSFDGVPAAVILCTIFQANYQMASLIFIPCIILCYMFGTGIDRLRNHTPIRHEKMYGWFGAVALFIVCSLINPYGYKGALYLFYSFDTISGNVGSHIVELQQASSLSLMMLVCTYGVIAMVIRICKKQEYSMVHFLFLLGTTFMTMLAVRNFCLSILAFILVYSSAPEKEDDPDSKAKQLWRAFTDDVNNNHPYIYGFLSGASVKNEVKDYIPKIIKGVMFILATIFFVLAFFVSQLLSKKSAEPIIDTVDAIEALPEDAKIYTSFDTGALVEYAGRKTFMDARPELYTPKISGSNLLDTWDKYEFGDGDIAEYVTSSDWDYYLIKKGTRLEYYLKYSGTGEEIYSGDFVALYKYQYPDSASSQKTAAQSKQSAVPVVNSQEK